jgi:hypothetical protein
MRRTAVGAILLAMLVLAVIIAVQRGTLGPRIAQEGRATDASATDMTPALSQSTIMTPSPANTALTTPNRYGSYSPIPNTPDAVVTSLSSSEYSDLLVPLQRELDRRDTNSITDRLHTITHLAPVGDMEAGDMPGLVGLDAAFAGTILDSLFGQGAKPKIQGYLKYRTGDGTTPCIAVVIHGLSGTFAIPTETPDVATSEFGAIEGGDGRPASLHSAVMLWRFCRDGDDSWQWEDWWYGDTDDEVVSAVADRLGADTYFAIRQ